MAAQARMRAAKVLVINLSAVGGEIVKNLVLSGIGSLTILDDHRVCEEDLGAQFFVTEQEIGQFRCAAAHGRIQDMNPRVKLDHDTDNLESKGNDWFTQFDLIIATELNKSQILQLNDTTRKLKIPLYVAGLHGVSGYVFVDLIEFTSKQNKKSSQQTPVGQFSRNRYVVKSELVEDSVNGQQEIVSTKHTFTPFCDIFTSNALVGARKRFLKLLTHALPLTLALFEFDRSSEVDSGELGESAREIMKQLHYTNFDLNAEYIETFARTAFCEFAPTAAILGGAVAQDVINILGRGEEPLNNLLIFDGLKPDMPILEF